jgi:metal-dependent hydrolase (beta-lactamase superfamily II)
LFFILILFVKGTSKQPGKTRLMESDNRAIESVAENFKKLGVIKAGPTHCSGPEAARIFKEKYGKKFVSIKTGQALKV